MNKFGEILKQNRLQTKLTQSELAHLSGVSVPMVQLIEAGKGNPSLKVAEKLLSSLGMKLSVQFSPPLWSELEKFGFARGVSRSQEKAQRPIAPPKNSDQFADLMRVIENILSEIYREAAKVINKTKGATRAPLNSKKISMNEALSQYLQKNERARDFAVFLLRLHRADRRFLQKIKAHADTARALILEVS